MTGAPTSPSDALARPPAGVLGRVTTSSWLGTEDDEALVDGSMPASTSSPSVPVFDGVVSDAQSAPCGPEWRPRRPGFRPSPRLLLVGPFAEGSIETRAATIDPHRRTPGKDGFPWTVAPVVAKGVLPVDGRPVTCFSSMVGRGRACRARRKPSVASKRKKQTVVAMRMSCASW